MSNGNTPYGGSVGTPPVANRELQVKAQMLRQNNRIEELAKAVAELEKRLSTVLRPDDMKNPDGLEAVKAETLVQHAIDLRISNDQIGIQTAILRSILDRLEI